MTGSATVRIVSIQALRGVAATAVVLSHTARHLDKTLTAPYLTNLFQAGHAGVDLFFAISGFIILLSHRHDIGQKTRLRHYLDRRFSRVLPLYWIALGSTLAMSVAGGHGLPTFLTMLWSAVLLPTLSEPLLGVAWTLQFEMVFYAVFAVLIISRPVGLAFLMTWLLWIALAAIGFGSAGVPSPLCGIYGLEFFMGMASAQLLIRGRVPVPRLIAGAGIAIFVAAFEMESVGLLDGYGVVARFAYGIPAALIILGLAAAEQAGRLTLPKWLGVLGGASYSIYLFQFVFISTLWQALLVAGFVHRLPVFVLFLALSCAALVGGLVTARVIEQPLLQLFRSRRPVIITMQA